MTDGPNPSARSQHSLDWLNFFVADVQTSFGPFIAVYLTANGWTQGTIGSVLTANSAIGLLVAIPAGALVDWTRHKRGLIAACIAAIAAGAALIAAVPIYPAVLAAELLHGISGSPLQTGLTAVGLGLVGHRGFHTRVGRNQRFLSFGTALTATVMGALGTALSPGAPFLATIALCGPALIALSLIRPRDIDDARARAAEGRQEPDVAGWIELLKNHRLLILAGCLFLFQFANASMLPLASERLATTRGSMPEAVTGALVVIPQVIAGLVAGLVARKAHEHGRKRLLVIAFAILPLQAVLFALTGTPWILVAVQALGGLTAPVIGIMVPLVVADVVRKSGRYNVALSATYTVGAIGATLSTSASGYVAELYGFAPAFAALAATGFAGFGAVARLLPETDHEAKRDD